MKNERVGYLIAAILFAILAIGYTVVSVLDFYYGYTPGYLTALHILTDIVFYLAAAVNWGRYRKV